MLPLPLIIFTCSTTIPQPPMAKIKPPSGVMAILEYGTLKKQAMVQPGNIPTQLLPETTVGEEMVPQSKPQPRLPPGKLIEPKVWMEQIISLCLTQHIRTIKPLRLGFIPV